MVKKTKKKGFTFVEVLVTIVVISLMVGVSIPVVNYTTVRAKAAANAANLRSIEGKLQNMRLQYPDDFDTKLAQARGIYEYLKETYEFVADVLYGKGAGEILLTEEYGTFTADTESIQLPVSKVVVNEIPKSKGINLPGTNLSNGVILAENTPMTIYITDDNITAAYSYYTADVFADIAEDGKFDGKIDDPYYTDKDGLADYICKVLDHKFDANGICERCGLNRKFHDCIDEYKEAWLGLSATPGQDYKCDICDATMGHECTYNSWGICELCGAGQHDCYDNNKDHYCDKKGIPLVSEDCHRRLSECDETVWDNPTGHYCSYCGGLASAHDFEWGKCRTCGRLAHVVPADCVDTPGDGKHTCSYQGCNQDVFKNHFDNNSNHECDDCRVELTDKHVDNKGTTYRDGWSTKERGNHYCDTSTCGKKMSDCADGDNDGHCDVCDKLLEHTCRDGNDKDYTCDVKGCDKTVHPTGSHPDSNTDYKCDVPGCSATVHPSSGHPDKNGDYKCDVPGCNEISHPSGSHPDKNKDHQCDVPGCTNKTSCNDDDKNHSCNTCTKPMGEHKHDYSDVEGHKCNYCNKTVSSHKKGANNECTANCGYVMGVCGCKSYEKDGCNTTCKNCEGHADHKNKTCSVETGWRKK